MTTTEMHTEAESTGFGLTSFTRTRNEYIPLVLPPGIIHTKAIHVPKEGPKVTHYHELPVVSGVRSRLALAQKLTEHVLLHDKIYGLGEHFVCIPTHPDPAKREWRLM